MDFFFQRKQILSKRDVSPFNGSMPEDYNGFMMMRWASIKDVETAFRCNQIPNYYWRLYSDNYDQAKILSICASERKIDYFPAYPKKKKEEVDKLNKDVVSLICKNMEISSRELKSYIEEFDIKLPKLS